MSKLNLSANSRQKLLLSFLCLGLMIPIAVSIYVRVHRTNKPKIAVISNCAADFWTIVGKGTEGARKDFDADVEFRMPAFASAAEQNRIVEDLIVSGVQGVAISPADAKNQTAVFNHIIPDNVYFITQDSDLIGSSKRKCYIGTDNAKAGWRVGCLVKEVIPDGGKLVLYSTKLDILALAERRQGVIAALAGLPEDQCKSNQAKELAARTYPINLGKYTLLDTMADNGDKEKCYANVVDMLVKQPDIKCLVGLWAGAPPAMLLGVKRQRKEGQIKLLGFDEDELTLSAIRNGELNATVVQNPYLFGYESVHILDNCIRKDGQLPQQMPSNAVIEKLPDGLHYFVAPRVIKKSNNGGLFDLDVDSFAADLKLKKG